MSEHPDHRCLVAFAKCRCLAAVTVLDHGDDARAFRDAATWAKRGDDVQMMLVSEFRKLPFQCPDHPDGAWDSRRRYRPLAAEQDGFGL